MKKIFFLLLAFSVNIHAQELKIEAFKAPFHVGKSVMACGLLKQVTKSTKQIYLNLDNTYPNQTLTVLIWQSDYPNFEQRFGNMNAYINKKICVRGIIKEYKNTLQINVANPQFLRIMQ